MKEWFKNDYERRQRAKNVDEAIEVVIALACATLFGFAMARMLGVV